MISVGTKLSGTAAAIVGILATRALMEGAQLPEAAAAASSGRLEALLVSLATLVTLCATTYLNSRERKRIAKEQKDAAEKLAREQKQATDDAARDLRITTETTAKAVKAATLQVAEEQKARIDEIHKSTKDVFASVVSRLDTVEKEITRLAADIATARLEWAQFELEQLRGKKKPRRPTL